MSDIDKEVKKEKKVKKKQISDEMMLCKDCGTMGKKSNRHNHIRTKGHLRMVLLNEKHNKELEQRKAYEDFLQNKKSIKNKAKKQFMKKVYSAPKFKTLQETLEGSEEEEIETESEEEIEKQEEEVESEED